MMIDEEIIFSKLNLTMLIVSLSRNEIKLILLLSKFIMNILFFFVILIDLRNLKALFYPNSLTFTLLRKAKVKLYITRSNLASGLNCDTNKIKEINWFNKNRNVAEIFLTHIEY